MVSVEPCGVGSGAGIVGGAEAPLQVQVSAAELEWAGKMAVVGSDHELGETVGGAVTVVLPEVAGSKEHQAAANTEAEEPLEEEDCTPQEWVKDAQG